MAIGFRAAANSSGAATTSQVVTLPTGHASGDVCVIGVSWNGSPGTVTLPTGFVTLPGAANPYGVPTNPKGTVAYKILDGTEGSTVTITTSSSIAWGAVAACYTGCHATTPVGTATTNGSGTTSTSAIASAVTVGDANSWLVAGAGANSSSNTFTPPAGFTERGDTGAGKSCTLADTNAVVGATGSSGDKTFTISASRAWIAWMVELLPPSGLTGTAGQATETDTAQAVTKLKTSSVGQVPETDTAQSVSGHKTVAVGQPSTTNTAQPVTASKVAAAGQATETDSAGAVSVPDLTADTATETDTAQPVTATKTVAVAPPVETDAAQAVTVAKDAAVGLSSDSAAAQPVTTAKARAIGTPAATDTAQPVTTSKTTVAVVATETDTAQAVTTAKTAVIGASSESDAAVAVAIAKALTAGQATETDTAQTVTIVTSGGVIVVGLFDQSNPAGRNDSTPGPADLDTNPAGILAGAALSAGFDTTHPSG